MHLFPRFGRLLLCILCGGATILRSDAFAASRTNLTFARAPYLQFATPNSIHVVWRTEGPVSPVVRFGLSIDQLTEKVGSEETVTRASLGVSGKPIPAKWERLRTETNLKLPKLHSAPIGTFQYEARLSGLQPSTRYYYAVFDGEERMSPDEKSYSFVTPPPVGSRKPIRFWVLGDGGTGRPAQLDVHRAMLDHVKQDGRPLDFWVHVGDMAYGAGRDVEFQSRFFESYGSTLRGSVCWPTMGNHEGGTSRGTTGIGPYYDAYVLPKRGEAGGIASGTEAYYSFDHGNLHFICLDSHDLDRKPTGAMAKWLKADLERTKAEWVIAFWHHPPYTKGSHDSDKEADLTEVRQHLMPLIDSGGVDLVLTGHSHSYERSMLIDGAYATPTVAENVVLDDGDGDLEGDGAYRKSEGVHSHQGVVHIVTGNAGQNMKRNGTIPFMRKTMVEFGSVIIEVEGDMLTAAMLNSSGKVRDAFAMVKRGKVALDRMALPWQPPDYKKPENPRKWPALPPVDFKLLIPKNAEWHFLSGQHPLRGLDWTRLTFDASAWKRGVVGFGYGDSEFKTEVPSIPGHSCTVYLRKEFHIEQSDKVTEIGLMINYKDAFIAYLNGREVARSGVGRSAGRTAQKIKMREDQGFAYVALKDLVSLRDGVNVLALEAHSSPDNNLDFCIDPYLLLED